MSYVPRIAAGRSLISAGILFLLAACGPADTPTVAGGSVARVPQSESAEPLPVTSDVDEILRLANAAVQSDRLFAPAGESALDYYLAAVEAAADEPADQSTKRTRRLADAMAQSDRESQVQLAIADIFPSGLVWVERAIEAGERAEASRVLSLLRRAQPQSLALQRLQGLLDQPPAPPVEVSRQLAEALPVVPIKSDSPQPESTRSENMQAPTVPATVDALAAKPSAVAAAAPSAGSRTAMAPPAVSDEPPAAQPAMVSQPRLPPVPTVLAQAAPRYPARALKQRIEGWVVVSFIIQPDGSVDDVSVIEAEPPGVFEREAIGSMQRWKFQPPGEEIAAQRQIDFKLSAR